MILTEKPRGEKRGFILALGMNTPMILPVNTDRDWDVRPTCERCGKEMSEGAVSTSRVVDGYIYTWWCSGAPCKAANCDRYNHSHQTERRSAADDHPEKVLPMYGIDSLFYGATLDTLKDQDAIVKEARKYAVNPAGNLFISGPTGRGKTHLAIGIMREMIKAGKSNMYFKYIPDLLIELKNTFDAGKETHITEKDVMDRYSEYRFLVLDDMGVEKPTDFAVAALDTIIDRRLRYLLPTVVTTNLTIAEVEETISPRLASRLESGRVWTLRGRDWRRKRG